METADGLQRKGHALRMLSECADWIGKRDELVRQAAADGVAKADIARVLKITRSTVYEILARPHPVSRADDTGEILTRQEAK